MKKVLAWTLVGAMMTGLVACGSESPAPTETTAVASKTDNATQASDETTKAQSNEQVTLRFSWWGNDARHEKTIAAIKLFEEAHPNVTIEPEYRGKSEREKVATELSSGTCADIVQLNTPWMGDFVENGDFFVDLSQYDFDMTGFDEGMIKNYCTYNDTLITLPAGMNARIFLANKTKLDELNIPCNLDTSWTWDKVVEIGKQVHEADSNKYFLNADKVDMVEFILRPYIVQKTGKLFIGEDNKPGFTVDDLKDGLSYISSLYKENVVVPATDGNTFLNSVWTNPNWINGNLATELTWTSIMPGAIADSTDEYTVTGLPVMDGAKDTGIIVKPTSLYAITKTSEHPEVAAEFLNFILTETSAGEILSDCRGLPTYKKVQEYCLEKGLIDERIIKATDYAVEHQGLYENTASTNTEVITALQDAVETVSYDTDQIDKVAESTMKLIEDILSAL